MPANGNAGTEPHANARVLTEREIERFIADGFVRIDNAFSAQIAAEAREILWRDMGCDPNDSSTWTKPVIRLWDYSQRCFRDAANTPVLHKAFNQLVGKDRWIPRESLGTFPIRFPHADNPGDGGWHVDASFAPDPPTENYLDWRVNVFSKGRALLMLFLFSDVSGKDAPTRIRIGSHLTVAKLLAPAGKQGLPMIEISRRAELATRGAKEALATGSAGTVYLCHPFLLHAAQPHHGSAPRFMAQPPLAPRIPIELTRPEEECSPVERAICLALE